MWEPTDLHTCIYVHAHVYMYFARPIESPYTLHIFVYMYVFAHTHLYVYIYAHTYTHKHSHTRPYIRMFITHDPHRHRHAYIHTLKHTPRTRIYTYTPGSGEVAMTNTIQSRFSRCNSSRWKCFSNINICTYDMCTVPTHVVTCTHIRHMYDAWFLPPFTPPFFYSTDIHRRI